MAITWQPVDLASSDDLEHWAQGDPQDRYALPELPALTQRPVWHSQAGCRGHGPEQWFPGRGEPAEAARAICAGCPVLAECHAAGMEERHGIWAGLSARERKRQRRTAA